MITALFALATAIAHFLGAFDGLISRNKQTGSTPLATVTNVFSGSVGNVSQINGAVEQLTIAQVSPNPQSSDGLIANKGDVTSAETRLPVKPTPPKRLSNENQALPKSRLEQELQAALAFPNITTDDKKGRDAALDGIVSRAIKRDEFRFANSVLKDIEGWRHDYAAIRLACAIAERDSMANALEVVKQIRSPSYRNVLVTDLVASPPKASGGHKVVSASCSE